MTPEGQGPIPVHREVIVIPENELNAAARQKAIARGEGLADFGSAMGEALEPSPAKTAPDAEANPDLIDRIPSTEELAANRHDAIAISRRDVEIALGKLDGEPLLGKKVNLKNTEGEDIGEYEIVRMGESGKYILVQEVPGSSKARIRNMTPDELAKFL